MKGPAPESLLRTPPFQLRRPKVLQFCFYRFPFPFLDTFLFMQSQVQGHDRRRLQGLRGGQRAADSGNTSGWGLGTSENGCPFVSCSRRRR